MDRRDFLKLTALTTSGSFLLDPRTALAGIDDPVPKSNRFMLYLHFGSACGAASGLIMPPKPGAWPLGHFQAGKVAGSNNPLINNHTGAGSMVFHDYNKFLAPMVNDMCLVNSNPQNLDHLVGSILQKCGNKTPSLSPQWALGVTQNMKTAARQNPILITNAPKTNSVPDVTPIRAGGIDEFKRITRDVDGLPKAANDPVLEVLKQRFVTASLGHVKVDANLGSTATYQLNTLATGLAELNSAQGDIDALKAKLSLDSVVKLVAGCVEHDEIAREADNGFRESLILAGVLAKTGLANGMTVDLFSEDTHETGSDVSTPRKAGGRWALISLFWEWVRSVNLQNDILIVCSQEFARSPYNDLGRDFDILTADGKKTIRSPGRDHGLCMGTMFINASVPKGGRIGNVGENLAVSAGKDLVGGVDTAQGAFTSDRTIGSMLMRVFPELFPTERAVKKHWPNFTVVPLIVS